MRRRLDTEIVRRGLASDIEAATRLIGSHRVLVDGAPSHNPARLVHPGEAIKLLRPRSRHVGRGGEKLQGAIEALDLDLRGHEVLDVGASTGGFTDAALQNGAARVVAVDVGRGQLHERLRQDPRVMVRDRTNIRITDPTDLGEFDSVMADLSFISLSTVMDNLIRCTRPGGQLVLLVKPQFEVSTQDAGHNGGVIRERSLWNEALERTAMAGLRYGAQVEGMCVSPITGADGNVEFFIHLRRPAVAVSVTDHGSPQVDIGVDDLPAVGSRIPSWLTEMVSSVLDTVPTTVGGGL